MPTDEEQRAIQYRLDVQARERAREQRELLMRGNPAAALQLRRDWLPVTAPPDDLAIKEWQA